MTMLVSKEMLQQLSRLCLGRVNAYEVLRMLPVFAQHGRMGHHSRKESLL